MTIRDIARLAGVSAATVSRVVNRDSRVSTAKRGAVMAVIEQVHYQPSAVAQWLARGTSQAFGVLTEDLASDFYGQALKGIEAENKALSINPEYFEAMTYKNILLRQQALYEKSPARQKELLNEAETLLQKALEIRKKQNEGAGAATDTAAAKKAGS